MLSSSTRMSKKLKVQKPLVFPGHSSSLKTELVDAFNQRLVSWQTDSPSCNRLICAKCFLFWITNNTNPKIGTRQSLYPLIGIVDEHLPTPTSRTPSRWKEHQQTQYHLLAVDESSKAKTTRMEQYFSVIKTKTDVPLNDKSTSPSQSESSNLLDSSPSTSESGTSTSAVCSYKKLPSKNNLNYCRGAFPESMLTEEVRQGIMYQHLYYRHSPDSWWIIKSDTVDHVQKLVIHSVHCTPTQDISARNISKSSRRTLETVIICCKNCQQVGTDELQNRYIRRVLSKRIDRIGRVLSVSKKSSFDFCDCDALRHFIKTNNNLTTTVLLSSGLAICKQSLILLDYVKSQLKMSESLVCSSSSVSVPQEALHPYAPGINNLIRDFSNLLKNNPSFKDNLIVDLLRVVVSRFLGHKNSQLPTQALNFYLALDHKSRNAADFVSTNLMGPALQSIQRIHSKDRKSHVYQYKASDIFERLEIISSGYEYFTFALQVDATKCPEHVGICQSYGFIAGYSAPYHVRIPEEDHKDESLFSDKSLSKASEIKVAMITIQEPKKASSKSYVIAGRPQTSNEKSTFTKDIATLCRRWCVEVNCKASFIGTLTDGVSTESQDIDDSNDAFMENRKPDFAMTDNNHNAKSIRQALLGRAIRVGYFHFDTGLLQLIDLSEDTWRVKDFADDGKVLKLASHKTVYMLANVTGEDGRNVATTSLFLCFLHLKVFAINLKDLSPDKRVIYLMSVLCFFTSTKGFSITTLRNLVREIVPSFFLVFCGDCPHPRLATSEPIEHKFGTYRSAHGEFTCAMFPTIVEKEAIACTAMMTSNLKNGRDTNRCGYMTTIDDSLEIKSTPVPKKIVEPVDPDAKRSSGNAVANCIWNLSVIAEYMNAGAVFIKHVLKGMGCSENKLSPFIKVKWEKTDHCLQKLHQLLCQYRSNTVGDDDEDFTSTITSDLLDLEEEERRRDDCLRETLLQELLCEENYPQENDLVDIQSINPVACLDDDSSIDSIDNLENLVLHDDIKKPSPICTLLMTCTIE